MKPRAPLNHVQEAILHWIAAGSPPGVVEGHTHKTTAAALQNRKLVTISKKGGTWSAAITPAGQYYVTHSAYPPTVEAPAWRPAPERPPSPQAAPSAAPTSIPAPAVAKTVALIQEIQDAGGAMTVERFSRRLQLVSLAIKHGKVPAGMRLYEQNVNGRTEIRLEPLPEWIPTDLPPIPVPLTLRGAGKVVTDLRDGEDLKVKGTSRSRGLRLLQALIATAESRGYTTKANTVKRTWQDPRPERAGLFIITIRGHGVGVDLVQPMARSPHEPTVAELRRAERDRWFTPARWDETPGDRLCLRLDLPLVYKTTQWKDTSKTTLEAHLPHVLRAMELACATADDAQRERGREAERQRQRWEAAMEQARADHAEAHRRETVDRQVADWRRATELEAYIQAMTDRAGMLEGGDREQAAEWLKYARQRLSTLNPLLGQLRLPAIREPSAEDLRPYLRGESPYAHLW